MPSAFATAFKKKATTFKEAKGFKHKTGKSFGKVDVPDGTYSAVVKLEANVPTKGKMEGIPIVKALAAITAGQYQGLEPSTSFFCEGKPVPQSSDEMPTAEQQLLGLLEFLLPDVQIDSIDQVEQAIDLVNERGPLVMVAIRNTKNTATGKEYQNLYFNKVIKEATLLSNSPSDAGASSATTPGESSAESNSAAPEVTYVPAKGDMVFITSHDDGIECEVKQVSQARQTANVEDADGNKTNGVPWSDLELM